MNTTLQKGYLWSDALRVAAELDGTGAVVSRFVYGTRPNGELNLPGLLAEAHGVARRIGTI